MAKNEKSVEARKEKAAPAPAQPEEWRQLRTLRNEIDRLFDDFGGRFPRWPFSHGALAGLPGVSGWQTSPAIEFAECDDHYRITAEVPGMGADDVEIKLSDGSMTIRGERSREKKEEKEDYLLSERRYGAFQRILPLPDGIDPDGVAASLANGVLTVTVPKSVEAKQKERKIEVKAA